MGFGFHCSILVLSLFFSRLSCQQPNTDGFFVSELLKKMGFDSSPTIFNFSAPVCSWQGVFCDSDNEHIIEFFASGSGLSGSIPDNTIGKLSKLRSLDLSSNRITDLPTDFWSLGTLKSLNLSNNQISSPLRNDIGNFGLLETFDISANNFSGRIPETLSSLTSLRVLKLGRNMFENVIPSGVLKCQSLIFVDASSNRLTGSLPDGFGAAFPKLKTLNLAGNEINGRETDFLGMKSLTSLNISGNLFMGSALEVLKEQMEVIDLSRNQFYGHISQVHFDSSYNWSHLVHLDLSENQFSGQIFHFFNQAQNLKHLNLAYNRFTLQKFPRIENLVSLEYLNLSKTSLIYEIPTEVSQLKNLNTLDLSYNQLTGRIPTLSVKNLQVLDVSHNNLTGEIPFLILEKLSWIEKFNFSYNNFTFCSSKILPETLLAAFFGSSNSCPIAANPSLFQRKARKHEYLSLVLVLTICMIFLLVGLLLVAFSCRRKGSRWVVKQPSFKEEQNILGPFSFQTDSRTWVADIKQATSVRVVIFEKPLLNITFADLLSATSNFDIGILLAEGKFGPVYRGFLPGGVHVAVKVLVHGSTLTDEEAAKELENLGRIKHPNLVPLMGYCLAGDQRIAIYDYMENGTLQSLLHDLPLGLQTTEDWSGDTWEEEDDNYGITNVGAQGLLTTWEFRHKIALGIARALAFLHHGCSPPIIHKGIKASSVYLDYHLEPRLSDFGLAKVFGNGLVQETSGGSPPGYTPLEFSHLEYDSPTTKSDVYCFGVVLFELVTGKKPVGDEYAEETEANLVTWVRGLVRKNQGSKSIDPKILDTGPTEQMVEALKIGYLCTADLEAKRPSMQQIVGLLKDIEPPSHHKANKQENESRVSMRLPSREMYKSLF